jgi:hypothetical protein
MKWEYYLQLSSATMDPIQDDIPYPITVVGHQGDLVRLMPYVVYSFGATD